MRPALRQIQYRYERLAQTADSLSPESRKSREDIPALLAEVRELRGEVSRLENLGTRYAHKIENLTWDDAGTDAATKKTCRLCGATMPDHAPECQAVNLIILKNP